MVLVGVWPLAGCRLGRAKQGVNLSSPDPNDRAKAVIIVGQSGEASAVPLLVDRLEDEDEAVRFYAIQALVKIAGTDRGYRYYEPFWQRARAVRRWRSFLEVRADRAASTQAMSSAEHEGIVEE
jgi:hypothetical protein